MTYNCTNNSIHTIKITYKWDSEESLTTFVNLYPTNIDILQK